MTPLLARALDVAGSQVGTREVGRNRGPRVDEYIKACGLDPERGPYPWCVCFLQWVFREAAASLDMASPLPCTASVIHLWGRTPEALRTKAPESGHIFCINKGEGLGHAGLVVDVYQGAPAILITIEGNTSPLGTREGDGVYRRSRRLDEINLGFLDFGRLSETRTSAPAIS